MFTTNPRHKKNLILELTFDFALNVISYTDELIKGRHFVIGDQLLKSGTSIGANVREAQNAESTRDFIHKMKVAMKEVEETEYWLLLCSHAERLPHRGELLIDLRSIAKVLTKIISSSRRRKSPASNNR